MKKLKKIISVLLMLTIVLTLVPSQNVQAAVKLNKKSISLEYHNYTNLKVTGTSKKVTWKSSNKNVVTVNSKGKLFASGVGAAYVSAKVGNKTYKCKVKTFKKDLTAFDLDLYNTISIGDTICVIKIDSTPSYYTTADLIYTSSNPSVATVDNNGFVHGVSAGTAVITATYGNLSQSMNITVKSPYTVQLSANSYSLVQYKSKYALSEVTIHDINVQYKKDRVVINYLITKNTNSTYTLYQDYPYFSYTYKLKNSSGVLIENSFITEQIAVGETVQGSNTIFYSELTPNETYTFSFANK